MYVDMYVCVLCWECDLKVRLPKQGLHHLAARESDTDDSLPVLQLAAKLLGVESGQDAIIRTELYRQKYTVVSPYNYTVADFSNAISTLRNSLPHQFLDEGLVVSKGE